ncbi:hypothetical protein SAMN02745227_01037 [Anaerobranca californiensis DSM 14826]|jgi:hypothetical protein|uniref:Uncharacterized protein n=1 Tax=Anaerobranca californiensis DSM 14826 TaxID=1120989 RepID=A0A1M6N724_9FIRM|nr:hypothetical protein [Anaerobranca californiensis]SHJ91507.1 hypothetical protein SAMN02745227_01037 [Anaerobranca californiensis DSM 14826]
MDTQIVKMIIAIVITPEDKDKVMRGGFAPVFIAKDREEQQKISTYLARVTTGVVHDLENGVLILAKH